MPHTTPLGEIRPRSVRRRMTVYRLLVADTLMIIVAGLAATYARFGTVFAEVAFENLPNTVPFWLFSVAAAPLWIISLAAEGMYDPDRVRWGSGEINRVARGLSIGVVAFIVVTYGFKSPGLSRAWTVLVWVFGLGLVLLGRGLVYLWTMLQHRRGKEVMRTLIVGSNSEAADLARVVKASPDSGLYPIGCLASSQAERLALDFCIGELPCLGSARDIGLAVRDNRVDTVMIASSAFDHDVLARIVADLRDADVDVHISSGLFEVLTSRVLVSEVGGVPLITVKGLSLSRLNVAIKRSFDLVVASGIVVFGLPIWLAIMAAIKLNSPGPVFFVQERVGRAGTTFGMLKFRSMVADADALVSTLSRDNEASGPLFKIRDDPRVTSVGRWMRKFSVDEFPQLLNVLRGEMSLVGPRPPLPREVEQYSPYHWRRLEVVPGMTGLWQVSGRSSLTFEEMVRLDVFYIENWSVGLDMALMLRTIPAVLFAKGAY